MKHTISYFVSLAALLLAGCAADYLPGSDPGSNAPTVPTVSVSDNGYAPATAATATAATSSDTRAVENGYRTGFTAGDRIGFFAVKNRSVVPGCKNVCLTATATDDGGLVWTGDAWYAGTDATYYAYYPYQEDSYLEQNGIDPTATTAEAFFARGIAAWTPAADQRDYATGYTASDLMVGRGILGVNGSTPTLAVGLTHQMSLAVVEFPQTVYQFTNTPALADYTAPASVAFDAAAQPYVAADGTFRYLVNPAAATATTLAGSYDDGQRLFSFAASEIAAGAFRTYKIDGLTPFTKSYTLQVGDYLLADGNLLPRNVQLTEAQRAACLGRVIEVSHNASDNCTYQQKDGTAMTAVRAYVLALRDANGGNECVWSSSNTSVDHSDMDRSETAFSGYKNTQAIIAVNGGSSSLQENFPATYYATVGYENEYPSPSCSSGWFLPSAGQLECGGNLDYLSVGASWSSTEIDAGSAYDVRRVPESFMLFMDQSEKSMQCLVRPVLVF